ncbi:MAG: hypothetical protein HQL19_08940, partial [Candidatus Omnitrophica bacterium]|nr:hypothetical protein [Candidatus Omnitrophota bacterium]
MKRRVRKLKLGIVGCGAIGSRIALSTQKELKSQYMVSALYDIAAEKAEGLSKRLKLDGVVKRSVSELVGACDLVVECVNT